MTKYSSISCSQAAHSDMAALRPSYFLVCFLVDDNIHNFIRLEDTTFLIFSK